ncbi:hypothetical protein [Geosporobacter ferrireducens]|nr:hypothetical protein [Geosporobacter ferrireducens]
MSYENYISQYENGVGHDEYRYKIAKSIELLKNPDAYMQNKNANSMAYKKISDLIFYMQEHIEQFPKFKAFLWTLESRDMKGKYFGVVPEEELKEQAKLINLFLNLLYWKEKEHFKIHK